VGAKLRCAAMRSPAMRALAFRNKLPRRERGVVLMIALIVLVALTLAGLSMIRAVDTGSVIAGNLSFRQAAVAAVDYGLEEVFKVLPAVGNSESDVKQAWYEYYARVKKLDGDGVPITGGTWGNGAALKINNNSYDVRAVVERMCYSNTPAGTAITDLASACIGDPGEPGGSVGFGKPAFTKPPKLNYRVTVMVTGPRNTVSYGQGMMSY
jgi:type IV pilus assembly protein PilX